MKLYRISQDDGGGKIIVKLVTNKRTGEFNAEIVGHKEGASCADGVDESILNDLLNAEVEGFGNLMIKTDEGKTPEYFEEIGAKKSKPMIAKPFEEEDEDILTTPQGQKVKKMDLGYGV